MFIVQQQNCKQFPATIFVARFLYIIFHCARRPGLKTFKVSSLAVTLTVFITLTPLNLQVRVTIIKSGLSRNK